jgi:excisionase family DNA binding protein
MDKEPLSLLTPGEAVELLYIPTETILKVVERKELQAFKMGDHWRIRGLMSTRDFVITMQKK